MALFKWFFLRCTYTLFIYIYIFFKFWFLQDLLKNYFPSGIDELYIIIRSLKIPILKILINMKQILKEHRLDFIARYRTIQKFNIAETEQRYGKPTCMKCSWKRIKNYINVCHWKYENIIDAETKEENNIYIYMILFRYRISDKNDIDESINIDELIVKSRNNANLNILWNIFNNIEQFKRNPDYLSPVSIFN